MRIIVFWGYIGVPLFVEGVCSEGSKKRWVKEGGVQEISPNIVEYILGTPPPQ